MKVFITGGAGAIGSAIIERLALDSSAQIHFTFHSSQENADQLIKKFKNTRAYQCDLSSIKDVKKLADQLKDENFDVIINNAFSKLQLKKFQDLSWEEVESQINVGVRSAFILTQSLSAQMKKRRSGTIINMLSSVVKDAPAQMTDYVIAKFAQLGFHQSLCGELVKLGVRVYGVSPAMVKTNLLSQLPEHYVNMTAESMPHGKLIEPQAVAKVVSELVSQEHCYVNGENIFLLG